MADGSIEPKMDIETIEQLMTGNLSRSQLDLVMHGEGDPFAPGHVKPQQYSSEGHQRATELNKMFLESEKKRISNKKLNDSKNVDANDYGEAMTETSTL